MAERFSPIVLLPSDQEIKKILTAKITFEAHQETPDKTSWNQSHFRQTPWGIAYLVSPARNTSGAPEKTATAVRYFFIAVTLGWQDLVLQLKRTLKNYGYTAEDMAYFAKVWPIEPVLRSIKAVESTIDYTALAEQAISTTADTLVEAIEKHSTLNPKLFTKDETLKTKVRNKMLEIVDEFLTDLRERDIKIKVDDILLIGSNASYNYTKDSDIDLHILANTKSVDYPEHLADALYGAYRSLFNKQLDITICDIPLELFVETEDSTRVSNGIYSVKKDKWLKKPVHEDIPEYDKSALDKLVTKWELKYKELVNDIKADKLKDEKKVVKLLTDIYEKLRKKGVAKSEYSIENLAFKELRNKGYLNKLKDYRNELTSKRLSLEERLDRAGRADIYAKITYAAGSAPIIQDNGMFFIYNLKATEITRALQALRQLPFVSEVYSHENGKYDFSKMATTNLPTKYYDIRGQITYPIP